MPLFGGLTLGCEVCREVEAEDDEGAKASGSADKADYMDGRSTSGEEEAHGEDWQEVA